MAALAAVLFLAPSSPAEARPHRGKSAKKAAAAGSAGSAAAAASRGARTSRKAGPSHVRRNRRQRAAAPAHRRRRSGDRTVIRQNDRGEVVIDKVAVVGLPKAAPAAAIRELQNYPPAPCDGADSYPYLSPVLIEAHVHDAPPDGAGESLADLQEEGDAPLAVPASTGSTASLGSIARKLGSFFRPKSSAAEIRPQDVDLTELVNKSFLIPVAGVDADRLRDSFLSSRGRHAQHLAIDIGAPKGTPILATTDGEIVRVSRERRGGKAIYQKDATGQYLLFYCHLSEYAEGLEPGRRVHKGDVIGFVGSTGHVIGGPHLHFSITRVPGDTADFKKGLAINPYLLFLAGVP